MNKSKCRCPQKSDKERASKAHCPKCDPQQKPQAQSDHNNNKEHHHKSPRKKSNNGGSKDQNPPDMTLVEAAAAKLKYDIDTAPIIHMEGHELQLKKRTKEKSKKCYLNDLLDLDLENGNVGTTPSPSADSFTDQGLSKKSVQFSDHLLEYDSDLSLNFNSGRTYQTSPRNGRTTATAASCSTSRSCLVTCQQTSSLQCLSVSTSQIVGATTILPDYNSILRNKAQKIRPRIPPTYNPIPKYKKHTKIHRSNYEHCITVAKLDSIKYTKTKEESEDESEESEIEEISQPQSQSEDSSIIPIANVNSAPSCQLPEEVYKLASEELEQLLEELESSAHAGDSIRKVLESRKNFLDCCCTYETMKTCLEEHPEFLDKYILENIPKAKLEGWNEEKENWMFGPNDSSSLEVYKSEEFFGIGDSEDPPCPCKSECNCSLGPQRLSIRIGTAILCDNPRMMTGEIPWDDAAALGTEPARLMNSEEVKHYWDKYGIDLTAI